MYIKIDYVNHMNFSSHEVLLSFQSHVTQYVVEHML